MSEGMEERRLHSKSHSSKDFDHIHSQGKSKRDDKLPMEQVRYEKKQDSIDVQDERHWRHLQETVPFCSLNSRHSNRAASGIQDEEKTALQSSQYSRRRAFREERVRADSAKEPATDHVRDRNAHACIQAQERRGKLPSKDQHNSVWHHDRYYELNSDKPREKRKRVFRETKLPVQDGKAEGKVTIINDKGDGLDKFERERGKDRHNEAERTDERDERDHVLHKSMVWKDHRMERDPRNDNNSRYGGRLNGESFRDRPGGRQYRTGRTSNSQISGIDKWKHDMFEQANRSPTPTNEQERLAKIEALLAS